MKKISVYEFKKYVSTIEVGMIWWAENNKDYNPGYSFLWKQLPFQSIRVSCNPNRIYLENDYGTVCIQDVKHINLRKAAIPTRMILDVVCGCYDGSNDIHIGLTMIEKSRQ